MQVLLQERIRNAFQAAQAHARRARPEQAVSIRQTYQSSHQSVKMTASLEIPDTVLGGERILNRCETPAVFPTSSPLAGEDRGEGNCIRQPIRSSLAGTIPLKHPHPDSLPSRAGKILNHCETPAVHPTSSPLAGEDRGEGNCIRQLIRSSLERITAGRAPDGRWLMMPSMAASNCSI